MDYNILLSHGIEPRECSHLDYIDNDKEILIFAKIKPSQKECIYCYFKDTKIKEYKQKTIKSLHTGVNSTIITLDLPRYYCPSCNKTYTHNIKTFASKSLTNVLKKKIVDKFATICTFKSIAKEYNISLTEVINVFDETCPNLKAPFSEAICIDEFSNIRNSEFKFACVIIDFYTHKIIDILPSRTTPYLDEYFSKLPLKTRQKVKYVVTDMYDGYISAIKKWLPNATIAIDPFHYMEYLTEAVQSIRRRILSDESLYFQDKSWMNTHWRLLTTNPKNYPNKMMTLKSGMTISYYDRVYKFVQQDNELQYAFLKVQDIFYELNKLKQDKASNCFNFIIDSLASSTSKEFVECSKTWNHYKEYIINSFIKYKDRRLSNGPIEGINKRVKELKAVMSGYRNTKRFYKRIILVQNIEKGR